MSLIKKLGSQWFKLTFLLIIFRIFFQLIAGWAQTIPFKASFPYWESVLVSQAPPWLWFWGNFDGVHYLNIAQVGYRYGLTQAFFPLYPLLIRCLNFFVNNYLYTALLISHISFIGFIYYFIKLGLLDYSSKTVRWSVILLLLFPASFFFFGVYTESLFLFLAAAAFYFARQKNFYLSAVLVSLASATRLIGIFLLPAILWEYRQSVKKTSDLKTILIAVVGSTGLLSYLTFLQFRFHDFLIFVNSQPGFGAGRQVNKLIMPYQVIFRYIKMLSTVNWHNEIYPVLAFEFLAAVFFLTVAGWAIYKKFRSSYLIFLIPAILLPTFTGSFSSMPRYLLAAFPLFYFLGNLKNKQLKIFICLIFSLLLIWAFIRFSRGYWLA